MQVIYQLKNVVREHFAIKIFKRSVKRENSRFIYKKKNCKYLCEIGNTIRN